MKQKIVTSYPNLKGAHPPVTTNVTDRAALIITTDGYYARGETVVEALKLVFKEGARKMSKGVVYSFIGCKPEDVGCDDYGGATYPRSAVFTKIYLTRLGAIFEVDPDA